MASHGTNSLPPTALDGDPPTGAVTDGAHAIADLIPSKEIEVTNALDSPISESLDHKIEVHDDAPHRSKGKVALIMSALCVSPPSTNNSRARGSS